MVSFFPLRHYVFVGRFLQACRKKIEKNAKPRSIKKEEDNIGVFLRALENECKILVLKLKIHHRAERNFHTNGAIIFLIKIMFALLNAPFATYNVARQSLIVVGVKGSYGI